MITIYLQILHIVQGVAHVLNCSFQNILIMSFEKLRSLIIEDEEFPMHELSNALGETEEFIVCGIAASIESGYELIKTTTADILFLDIKLEGGLCFSLLNELKNNQIQIPLTVIITGCRDFEYVKKIHNDYRDIVIYILDKPFWENWIHQKDTILEKYFDSKRSNLNAVHCLRKVDLLPIYSNKKSIMVRPDDIVWAKTGEKAKGNTEIYLESKVLKCNTSLVQLLQTLPSNFLQISRFEIINIQWISYIEHVNKEIYMRNGQALMIGSSFYKNLCKSLGVH